MAKKVTAEIRLQIPAGAANPAPPVGPALGQAGVNIMEFCKQFNAATQSQAGTVIPVVITVYQDRSFTFITKSPPAPVLIKKLAGLASGSKAPGREKAGKITRSQIKQIVLACNKELGVNVMLAEYGYANETGLASGTFASWNNEVHGYKLTDEDGAKFLSELITWGRNNGMAGIRPWAPELDWANPWFDFNKETKTATAKIALFNALKTAVQ